MTDGLAIHVTGDGPGVLWVHGYTITSALWRPLWSLLPGLTHHAVDLPGHGASAPLAPAETLYTLGARLAEYAQARGIRHVVGLSLGSTIALQVALSAPNAFDSLVMGAPAIGGGPTEPAVGARFHELLALDSQLGRGPWLADRWVRDPPDLFTQAKKNPALWAEVWPVIAAHRWDELPGFAIARLATPAQSPKAISALPCRILTMIGSQEMPAFVQTAALLGRLHVGLRQIQLHGVGHMCMLEAPEAAAAHLRAFWAEM